MDIGKYKQAMRPKKYLDGDFVVYDPSIPETREEFAIGGNAVQPTNTGMNSAALVDELTPGPLKDEMTKDYDPSQETYEEYLQRKSLEESTMGPGGYPMTAGLSTIQKLPAIYNTVDKAVNLIGSGTKTLNEAKKIVTDYFNQRKPYGGATKIGESTTKDFTPEKNFLKVLKAFMESYSPTLSGAAEKLGISRNTLKGIAERINLQETGKRTSSLGFDVYSQVAKIPEPKDGLQLPEITTLMKRKPQIFLDLKKQKDEFLDVESMGHYLGMKFARDDKGIRKGIGKFQYDNLGLQLKEMGVKKNKQGEYSINDTIDKLLDRNKYKIVKGERKSDIGKGRAQLEKNFDPELFSVRNNVKTRVTNRSQGLDVYLARAVDDAGHPYSLTKSEQKFKKLFKDSNINRLNTLVYQDHLINSQLFKNSGYEKKYENIFDKLAGIQNKKVTPQIRKNLLEAKQDLEDNYNYIQDIIKDPKLIDKYINKNEKLANKEYLKYLSESQGDRIQKIDIRIPKVGEKFKSEDIFVDMSVVNPEYILGYVNNINPTARKFKDLSLAEQELYKNNLLMQNSKIVSEFYKKARFPEEDVEAVRETVSMDFAEGGRAHLQEGGLPYEVGAVTAATAGKYAAPIVRGTMTLAKEGFKALGSPMAGLLFAIEELLSKDPSQSLAGLQLLYPEIIRQVRGKGMNAYNRMLALSPNLRYAPTVSRGMSLLGALMIGADVIYGLDKRIGLEQRGPLTEQELRDMKKRRETMPTIINLFEEASKLSQEEAISYEEAIKKVKDREGFSEGGPVDPTKRKFLKILGGLASLPIVGRLVKIGEKAPVVAETVTEGARKVPTYFYKLVDKIKDFGDDVTKRFATDDLENVYNYRTSDADYELYENVATGDKRIKIIKGDPDAPGYKEEELILTKGQADEQTPFVADEYDEYTVKSDFDGKMKDIEEGLDDVEDLIEEIGPDNISVQELQDMGYDVKRLGPVIKKKLGIE